MNVKNFLFSEVFDFHSINFRLRAAFYTPKAGPGAVQSGPGTANGKHRLRRTGKDMPPGCISCQRRRA